MPDAFMAAKLSCCFSNLESSAEYSNFASLAYIILNIISKHLRNHFIEKWDKTHPDKLWKSDNVSGRQLIKKIADGVKRKIKFKDYKQRLESGKENEWDITLLAYIMHDCGLSMFSDSRDNVQKFRSIRNSHFAHACSMSCSASSFKNSVKEIKLAAGNIFGTKAVDEVDEYIQKKQNATGPNGKSK